MMAVNQGGGESRWRLRRLMAPAAIGLLVAVGVLASRDNAPEEDENAVVAVAEPDPALSFAPAPVLSVSLADVRAAELAAEIAAAEAARVYRQVQVSRGDTFIGTLTKAGVDSREAHAILTALSGHFNPRRLQISQAIDLTFVANEQGQEVLTELSFENGFARRLNARRDEGGWIGERVDIPLTLSTERAGGVIADSLYLSARRQDLSPALIADLIRIFSYDVDFQREIREGDSFEVYFERHTSEDGERARTGDILFARLTLRGKPIAVYRFDPGDGEVDYFHEDGNSVRRALLRTPVDGARLSSGFGSRRHPILGYTRMHRGTDFAAPTGTPIMAAGDGVVERASAYGSYGNYVRIRHNSTYTTVYAHLSRYGRGIRAGTRVRQGQIIGYVGATGAATGPHLHYEVLVDGTHVNPLSVNLPTGRKLEGPQLTAFRTHRTELDQEIAATPLPYEVAVALEGRD